MLKKAIVLVAVMSLTGCWHAVDEAARAQAAAEAQAQESNKTQVAWTQAVAKVDAVKGQLVANNFATAKTDLDAVYRQLYGVVTAADLTPELRSRVTRVFPTLIQLQSKVDAREAKDAAILADKLADLLRDTNDYMVSSGWLRGGGAGRGVTPNPEQEKRDRTGTDETPPVMDDPGER